ncbi:MAG: MYXO-CTERM domain-containing protein [Cognaticolwellia sp.]|jgi:MYXO-CTERM domain-containing protein
MLSILLPLSLASQAQAQTSPPLPLLEAQAGVDFLAYIGQTVELAGGGSGAEELSYSWVRSGGPPAELDDPSSATPQFTAEQPGSYRWDLSVSSGSEASLPDTVTVMVVATETPKMESSCSTTGSTPLWGLGALALGLVLSRRRRIL